jgi:hypothetical protein
VRDSWLGIHSHCLNGGVDGGYSDAHGTLAQWFLRQVEKQTPLGFEPAFTTKALHCKVGCVNSKIELMWELVGTRGRQV